MFKNDMGFKKFKNVIISIKLHSFMCYSPRITRVIQFVCNPMEIPRTITHERMQFNA